jgi:multicomponent Na+:H+ antiporter subunit C
MSQSLLYMLTAALLTGIGLFHATTTPDPLKRILALNIFGSGVFLFLVGLGYRSAPLPPDPVPHAMVLTGLVVAVSSTALLLALHCAIHGDNNEKEAEN